MEAIARGLGDFTGSERDFSAWAFTIARRRIIDQRRRRRAVAPMSRIQTRCGRSWLPMLRTSTRSERLSAQDAIALITRGLSEEQADVVLLRVLGGLDAATVGGILGSDRELGCLSPSTVRCASWLRGSVRSWM